MTAENHPGQLSIGRSSRQIPFKNVTMYCFLAYWEIDI